MSDKKVRKEILERLSDEPDVDVVVRRGVVTLSGCVEDSTEEAAAVDEAGHVRGVQAVVDDIAVKSHFGRAIASGFSNYVNFAGRATRSQFWFWVLFTAIGEIVAAILDTAIFTYHPGLSPLHSPLPTLFTLATLLPSLAVAARRLHDTDRSGWWLLLIFTGIGILMLIDFECQEGTPGKNRFGLDPLERRLRATHKN
jgi:uncharacterized membrane protein YhaH (DUF805 family)